MDYMITYYSHNSNKLCVIIECKIQNTEVMDSTDTAYSLLLISEELMQQVTADHLERPVRQLFPYLCSLTHTHTHTHTHKYARWNENDIQHFLKTVGFHQKYSDIKIPALGFDFETYRAQPSFPPTSQLF